MSAASSEVECFDAKIDNIHAYIARPAQGGRAGVLLLPMATGIGEQMRSFAQEIATAGLTAVSWDPWHGASSDNTSMESLLERVNNFEDSASLSEMKRLVDYMSTTIELEKIGVIGWCVGGRFALLLAAQDERLVSVVAYHPTVPWPAPSNHTLDASELVAHIKVPVMAMYPKEDSIVSWDSYTRLRNALESRSEGASILHVYPGAEHGFANRGMHGNPANARAFAISWPQVLDFLRLTTSGF
ncbi:dienelactone hydrolase family protein [Rhodococcus wratislaviensis]|uniref:dienelactone hydrolase family protein n=1 Tax=Rhodococcus wratislaviensis TaxID=44752 RepID=UPI00365F604B